jgi:hypothetical protein
MSGSDESDNSDNLVDISQVDEPEIWLTDAELGCPVQRHNRAVLGFIEMQAQLLISQFGRERFEKFASRLQDEPTGFSKDPNDKDPDQEIVDFLINL